MNSTPLDLAHPRRLAALALAIATLVTGSTWAAPSERKPVDPRATRPAPVGDRTTPEPAPPEPEALPEPLTLHRATRPQASAAPAPATTARRAGRLAPVEREARQAATWALERFVRPAAEDAFYLAGANAGLRRALDDPRVGRLDEIEGRTRGALDPQARRAGLAAAATDADALAAEAAAAQVADAFGDLDREPRYRPDTRPPPWDAEGGYVVSPTLEAVFADLRPDDTLQRRVAGARHDAWWLYRNDGPLALVDARWADAGRAFDAWRSDARRSAFWRGLAEDGRRAFVEIFDEAFDDGLDRLHRDALVPAWRAGNVDGWRHGARIAAEWRFRVGYADGFERAAAAAAAAQFAPAYARALTEHYDREFRDWNERPHPALRIVDGGDDDDDGVLEPGETAVVRYELTNYGGAGETVDLRLAGRDVEMAVGDSIRLPARGVVNGTLGARIDPATPPRTRTTLVLDAAGLSERVELEVARPLEFSTGAPRIDRDDLAGRAEVRVAVRNRSRRPVVGVVRVERAERAAPLPVHELGQIPAGGVREATVALDGLDPLDLIEGSVRLQLAIEAEGVVQDRVAAGIGETVSDPGNRDLVRVLLALARDAAADPHSIERAQRLMVRRIESDWRRAVQGRGNPYKDDWRDQGRRTAVGDLAASYAAERGDLVRPDVFVGLGSEIDRLAGDLPGMHPLLRKYLRRLAGRLG